MTLTGLFRKAPQPPVGATEQIGTGSQLMTPNARTFWRTWSTANGHATRFVVTFALTASVSLAFYYFPYSSDSAIARLIVAYLHGYAEAAGTILHWLDPSVHVQGQEIVGRYALRIVRTCDAMDVKILFVSAVLAWPVAWRRKIIAAALGVIMLFAINVARICALYYIGIYAPDYFRFAHHELLPAIILVVAVGSFILFTARSQRVTPRVQTHEMA